VSRRGWVLFISLCLIWGMPYLMVRVAVRELEPSTLVFFRTLLAAATLTPFALRQGGLRSLLKFWPWILAFTLLEMSLPWLLIATAEQRLTSSLSGLLIGAMPLIGVGLYRLMGEQYRFDARHVAGLACGLAGVVALVGVNVGNGDAVGVFMLLIVDVCWAVAPIVVVKRLGGLSSVSVAMVALWINTIAFSPMAATHWPASVALQTVVAVLILAVLCTALAMVVYMGLLREVGPSRSAIITYVNPLVAVLLGVLILSEPLTLSIAIATPLILVGSILATAPSLAHEEAPPAGDGEGVPQGADGAGGLTGEAGAAGEASPP
jgi:drug/metabolite transporter (DMT)-like permease